MSQDDALMGRTALVTGAAKRIGRAIALALAEAGANVVVHFNRSSDAANATCAEITAAGVQCWQLGADLRDFAAAEGLARAATEAAGPVDILVNSASAFTRSELPHVTGQELGDALSLHAYSPLAISRGVIDGLPEGRTGRVVNLIDAYVYTYQREHLGYNLSKRALLSLTKMMALEFAPRATVNAVAPGVVLPAADEPAGVVEPLLRKVPLERAGEVSDVVGAVMFLLQADFITGQTLFVDGGANLISPMLF